jgi:hypothetical protein
MFLLVGRAAYVGDYKIEVVFNDGRIGVADFSEALDGPAFTRLRDPVEFARFSVDPELNTVVWESGADLAPEYIYFLAFKNELELQPLFKRWGYI